MAQKKTLPIKNSKTKTVQKNPDIENEGGITELDGPKAKKDIDIESALEPVAVIDEKIEEDILPITDETEDPVTEELSLDDDELNPFGDKWEQ